MKPLNQAVAAQQLVQHKWDINLIHTNVYCIFIFIMISYVKVHQKKKKRKKEKKTQLTTNMYTDHQSIP